jgi:hypothetical protein
MNTFIYPSRLAFAVLALTSVFIATGAIAAEEHAKAKQDPVVTPQEASKKYTLKFTDGVKALFTTPYGFSLVVVGSTIPEVGEVVAIERHNGLWSVRTNTDVVFLPN